MDANSSSTTTTTTTSTAHAGHGATFSIICFWSTTNCFFFAYCKLYLYSSQIPQVQYNTFFSFVTLFWMASRTFIAISWSKTTLPTRQRNGATGLLVSRFQYVVDHFICLCIIYISIRVIFVAGIATNVLKCHIDCQTTTQPVFSFSYRIRMRRHNPTTSVRAFMSHIWVAVKASEKSNLWCSFVWWHFGVPAFTCEALTTFCYSLWILLDHFETLPKVKPEQFFVSALKPKWIAYFMAVFFHILLTNINSGIWYHPFSLLEFIICSKDKNMG